MIRLVALYPNKAGARFDLKYYTETHMKLAEEKLKPFGLLRIEVDKGISGLNADAPAPFLVMGTVVFNSVGDLQKGLAAHGEELMSTCRGSTIGPSRSVDSNNQLPKKAEL